MEEKESPAHKLLLILILIFLYSFRTLIAQNPLPAKSFLFSDEEVARIDITIHPDSLLKLLNTDLSSDHEYPAQFKMTRGAIVKISETVGFRLRGNTSRYSQKKSFKVSINGFIPGNLFEGAEKINLNGEHNDPSISRAKICWDLFHDTGVPAPRANHIELYINDNYHGLYLNVEHIDERFADLRFNNNDGNLYKCLWPADLSYIGSDQDQYKFEQDGRRAYELTRNKETDDYSDLVNFIEILHNTPVSDLQIYLEPVFNVNSYLKNMVVEIMTGDWDNYSFNKNNYYLYHNKSTDKFEFIPYDVDNTFGIDWFGIDWAVRDIYNWASPNDKRPLYKKIMQNEIYRNRFSFYANRFLNSYFSPVMLEPRLISLREKIAEFAFNDNFRTLDYGYSYDDFYNSFGFATGDHVKYGILPFIEARSKSAREQLGLVNIAPIVSQVMTSLSKADEGIAVTALVEDEDIPEEVVLYYDAGDGYTSVQMNSTGGENYKAMVPAISSNGKVKYYIEAKDNLSQLTREPFEGEYILSNSTSIPGYFGNTPRFKVFPNPFNTLLNISISGDFKKGIYSIRDISGKIVVIGETSQSDTRISIDENKFSPGIYLFQIEALDQQNEIIRREFKKLIYIAR